MGVLGLAFSLAGFGIILHQKIKANTIMKSKDLVEEQKQNSRRIQLSY